MSIHTIGDSHSYFGWSKNICHHLGPILCYSFGKEKLNRCDIRKFKIKNGDTVVFCFGEIDCRCHIHKHLNDRHYKDVINSLVDDYFDAIDLNIHVSNLKVNVCVYNVVPPVKNGNIIENDEFPLLGTDEDRKNYVLYFNERLKEKCLKRNYIFFDVYNKYIVDGFLNKELSDGNVHIGNGIHISNFIKENLNRKNKPHRLIFY
jgi:hypothetical protein